MLALLLMHDAAVGMAGSLLEGFHLQRMLVHAGQSPIPNILPVEPVAVTLCSTHHT